jgi:hypothetical protein
MNFILDKIHSLFVSHFEDYIGKTISVDVCKYSKVENNLIF